MNLRQLNLRQIVALVGVAAGVVNEVERMLGRIERKQRSAWPLVLKTVAFAGAGAAVVTVALSPDLRRKLGAAVRDLFTSRTAPPEQAGEPEAAPAPEAPAVDADMPAPYTDGARP